MPSSSVYSYDFTSVQARLFVNARSFIFAYKLEPNSSLFIVHIHFSCFLFFCLFLFLLLILFFAVLFYIYYTLRRFLVFSILGNKKKKVERRMWFVIVSCFVLHLSLFPHTALAPLLKSSCMQPPTVSLHLFIYNFSHSPIVYVYVIDCGIR